jgi:hypothetical protein
MLPQLLKGVLIEHHVIEGESQPIGPRFHVAFVFGNSRKADVPCVPKIADPAVTFLELFDLIDRAIDARVINDDELDVFERLFQDGVYAAPEKAAFASSKSGKQH